MYEKSLTKARIICYYNYASKWQKLFYGGAKMLARKTKTALLPKYENVKSFYNKAQIEQIEISGGDKVYFLYSYKSLVSAIIETKDNYKYFYLNNLIRKSLLTSQTTLRHIKEFYKQFYKNETRTKAELLKEAILKDFAFLEVHETNDSITTNITEYKNYYYCISPETTKFFRNFKGYRQTQKQDNNGKYLYTKSVYGYSNYYFYYI